MSQNGGETLEYLNRRHQDEDTASETQEEDVPIWTYRELSNSEMARDAEYRKSKVYELKSDFTSGQKQCTNLNTGK